MEAGQLTRELAEVSRALLTAANDNPPTALVARREALAREVAACDPGLFDAADLEMLRAALKDGARAQQRIAMHRVGDAAQLNRLEAMACGNPEQPALSITG